MLLERQQTCTKTKWTTKKERTLWRWMATTICICSMSHADEIDSSPFLSFRHTHTTSSRARFLLFPMCTVCQTQSRPQQLSFVGRRFLFGFASRFASHTKYNNKFVAFTVVVAVVCEEFFVSIVSHLVTGISAYTKSFHCSDASARDFQFHSKLWIKPSDSMMIGVRVRAQPHSQWTRRAYRHDSWPHKKIALRKSFEWSGKCRALPEGQTYLYRRIETCLKNNIIMVWLWSNRLSPHSIDSFGIIIAHRTVAFLTDE